MRNKTRRIVFSSSWSKVRQAKELDAEQVADQIERLVNQLWQLHVVAYCPREKVMQSN